MIIFKAKISENILKYLVDFEGLSFNKIQQIFRKKDVKVNNVRVNKEYNLKIDDEIIIYANIEDFYKIETIFEDENIIILNKPKKIEVISETRNISLLNLININYFAVHRLDYNTEGLVVFAKNIESKLELDLAFKNGLVTKKYITICKNKPKQNFLKLEDFLIKENNRVRITKNKEQNSLTVLTNVNLIKTNKNFSLLEVELKTGRTHQIRAHLAYHNLFVLGDDKYGDFKINKQLNLKNQILKCYYLKFNFKEKSQLNYLNDKEFKTDYNLIETYFNNL